MALAPPHLHAYGRVRAKGSGGLARAHLAAKRNRARLARVNGRKKGFPTGRPGPTWPTIVGKQKARHGPTITAGVAPFPTQNGP